MQDAELGKLILKQAETFPETFWMGTWGLPGSCRTVACIGGHAMLMSGYRLLTDAQHREQLLTTGRAGWYVRPDGSTVDGFYGDEAQKLLGMSDEERFGYGKFPDDIFMDIDHGLARFRALLDEQ